MEEIIKVVANREITPFVHELCFEWPNYPKIRPGQFIVLAPLSEQCVMPRPFSIFDLDGKKIYILIQIVGPNTRLYANLKPGDEIVAIGIKGKPAPITRKKNIILVAGGIGIAPLSFLGKMFYRKKYLIVLHGAKTPSDRFGLLGLHALGARIEIIAERDSNKTGLVTNLLADELEKDRGKSAIYACGSRAMLKRVAEMTAGKNECYIFLETIMACGTHSCKGCSVPLKAGGYLHACHDGPVVDASIVDWEKFVPVMPEATMPDVVKKKTKVKNPLAVTLVGQDGRKLALKTPFMNASGCLDVEAIEEDPNIIEDLGMLITKGIELEPRAGNPGSRVCETFGAMINSIGLEGPGVDIFITHWLPRWLIAGKKIAINISGKTEAEYGELAYRLGEYLIDTPLEVNISCPNIEAGGMAFGVSPRCTEEVVERVRKAVPDAFMIVKLTPNVTDIVAIAKSAKEAGADAVTAINTLKAMAIDINTRRSRIGTKTGGLSGPAIKPIGVRMVYELAQSGLGLPIIGAGGISSSDDAIEYMLAGASAVQVGTGSFSNPYFGERLAKGVLEYMEKHGFSDVNRLVGAMIS